MKSSPLVPLDTLPTGTSGIICTLPDNADLRHRLMSFGFVIGTEITVVNADPAGDIKAYFFRSTVIALRNKDAASIFVKKGIFEN